MESTRRRVVTPRLLVIALLTIALSLGLFAATSLMPSTVDQAHAASISKKSITLVQGKTYKLKVKGVKAKKVKWSSSKKSVATVSKSGTVTAKKAGKATITAKYKKKKYKCVVTVKKKTIVYRADNTNPSIAVGKTSSVTITFTGDGTIRFNNSNNNVASAWWAKSWSGNTRKLYIKGLKPGTSTLKMTNDLNSTTFNIKVRVYASGKVSESLVMDAIDSCPNSYLNAKYCRTISDTDYRDGTKYTFGVVSDRSNGYLHFLCTTVDDDGIKSSINMYCSSSSSAPAKVTYVIKSLAFSGETSVSKSSYTSGKSLSWSLTNSSSVSSDVKDHERKLCDATLGICMGYWDALLYNETGYRLSNIGFSSF